MNNPAIQVDEITPSLIIFTFPGTVLQRVQVNHHAGRVFWHPSYLGGYPGISEKYRAAVDELVAGRA